MERVIINQSDIRSNEKGYYLRFGKEFMIIDKNYQIPSSETCKYEIKIVKEIKDRRGKNVKIVKLIPHEHEFQICNDDLYCLKCSCGEVRVHSYKVVEYKYLNEYEHIVIEKCIQCGKENRYQDYHRYELIFSDDENDIYQCQCGAQRVEPSSKKINSFLKERGDEVIKEAEEYLSRYERYDSVIQQYFRKKSEASSLRDEIEALTNELTKYLEGDEKLIISNKIENLKKRVIEIEEEAIQLYEKAESLKVDIDEFSNLSFLYTYQHKIQGFKEFVVETWYSSLASSRQDTFVKILLEFIQHGKI